MDKKIKYWLNLKKELGKINLDDFNVQDFATCHLAYNIVLKKIVKETVK